MYIYYRHEKGIINPYIAYKEILNDLAKIYEDTDRLENVCRDLVRL